MVNYLAADAVNFEFGRYRQGLAVFTNIKTDLVFIGYAGRRLMSVCNKEKIERILAYMLDESEFFGPTTKKITPAICLFLQLIFLCRPD